MPPMWVRPVVAGALAAVVLLHLGHLCRGARSERGWHAGHLLMALGMLDMLLPAPVPAVVGEAAFGVLAAASTAVGLARLRRYRPGLPWFAAAVGQAGMSCMFALPRPGFELLAWTLAGCCAAIALGWATGRLPSMVTAAPGGAAGHLVAVRVALVTMALAMAYLLVVMAQAGHHMTGM